MSAGGRLAWMFAGDLDLVGNLWVDLPYPLPREGSVYFRLETTTAIRKASGLTFDVRDLGYVAELGARLPLRVGVVLNAFLGQWGKERADASGAPYLRYAGIGVESAGYHGRERLPGVEGRARFGLVAAHREVDATAFFQGDARWSFPR